MTDAQKAARKAKKSAYLRARYAGLTAEERAARNTQNAAWRKANPYTPEQVVKRREYCREYSRIHAAIRKTQTASDPKMPKQPAELGYILARNAAGTCARFRCVECGMTTDLAAGSYSSPAAMAKHVEVLGWKSHASNKSLCYCPNCARSQRAKLAPATASTPIPAPKALDMNTSPRQPTADQRFAIRTALDKSFDDKAFTWLDGLNDQKVAESLGLPRIMVEQIREVAYGPIKVNPEIAAITAEIAALSSQTDAIGQHLAAIIAAIKVLQARLVKVAA